MSVGLFEYKAIPIYSGDQTLPWFSLHLVEELFNVALTVV
jgi:hypothetical protein